jgi:hypothetical protein
MIMDKDTPNRVINSIGQENLQYRKFFEDPTEGILPVKETEQVEIIQNPQGKWEKRTNIINYNQTGNAESRQNEHNFYKNQKKDLEEVASVADQALLNIISDINTHKQLIVSTITTAVNAGCASTVDPEVNPAPGGVVIGIGMTVYGDYAGIKKYEGLDDYSSDSPFKSDQEVSLTQSTVGKGYRTLYELNSEKATDYGIYETLTGAATTTAPVGFNTTTCVGATATIVSIAASISALRAQINDSQINASNDVKTKKTESELFDWGYGSTEHQINSQISTNQGVITGINNNVGLFTTT